MANVRKMILGPLDELGGAFVGKRGIYILASDGRSGVLTAGQIKNHFDGEVGTVAQRKAATIAWIKQQAVNALGAEQVPDTSIIVDFLTSDGSPLKLGVH